MKSHSAPLAAEMLRSYLKDSGTSQADFAKAAGMDASTLTGILSLDISISAKNLPKLLRAFPVHNDKLSFLAAYLRDQVPSEHTDEVSIEVNPMRPGATSGALCEVDIDPARLFADAAIAAIGQLPAQTQEQLYHLAKALRQDADLRTVFQGIMRYVPRAHPPVTHHLGGGTPKPLPGGMKPDPTLERLRKRAGRSAGNPMPPSDPESTPPVSPKEKA